MRILDRKSREGFLHPVDDFRVARLDDAVVAGRLRTEVARG